MPAPRLALALLAVTACSATLGPRPSARQIIRASGLARRGAPWPPTYLHLQDRLGPPTRIQANRYAWAAALGDDCYLIEVAVADDIITYVDDAYRRAPRSSDGYARCRAAAR